jgi:hypothetical protein
MITKSSSKEKQKKMTTVCSIGSRGILEKRIDFFSHNIPLSFTKIAFLFSAFAIFLISIIFANFYELLQIDDIVKNYDKYATKIHSSIINNNDKDVQLKFGEMDVFSLLVCTKENEIDIIYYVTPGKNNILIKKKVNLKAIISINGSGSLTKVK